MSLFAKQPTQGQLQKGLDREQDQYPISQAEEYMREQEPQPERPIFQPARKEFVVDLMGGWEKP